MAIDLGTVTRVINEQRRTWEIVISTPPNGDIRVEARRHVIDKDTREELRRGFVVVRSKGQIVADPEALALLGPIAALIDKWDAADIAAAGG